MKRQAPVQNTMRGVPREKAGRQKENLDQVILDELAEATSGRKRRADFSDLAGRWVADPGFDETLAAQRRIDRDRWK